LRSNTIKLPAPNRLDRLLGLVLAILLSGAASADTAGALDCAECHDTAVSSPSHGFFDCSDCHLDRTEFPHQAAETDTPEEPLCLQCHDTEVDADENIHASFDCQHCHGAAHEIAPPHNTGCQGCHPVVSEELTASSHAAMEGCGGCHGPAHAMVSLSSPESPVTAINQIENCAKCHQDLADSFTDSVHARALLKSGLISAPACTNCHGSHDILGPENAESPITPARTPETCGTCHELLLNKWVEQSAHGRAWKEGSEGPACTTCHSSHGVTRPTDAAARLKFPETCGNCHDNGYSSFRDSFHGQATDLGFVASAICSDCHTPHANVPASDPASSVHPDNLAETCGNCHGEVSASFLSFDPHNVPSDPNDQIQVYYIWLFMVVLLVGVFAFFGIHDLLWLQRSVVGVIRGEFHTTSSPSGRYVQRFSNVDIGTHVFIVLSFLLLALTGLPLKFHSADWAQSLVNLLGGVEMTRGLHRFGALVTFGYMMFHLARVFWMAVLKKERGVFWGPTSLVPQPSDGVDLWNNLKYFVYAGKRPTADRWTYWEKFDYLAVFWGVMIIGLSGLMLWFPSATTKFLPGWVLNAAHIVHSEEALLATGFIFIFHFFHTHLRPESFPLDPVVFTGRVPLEAFQEERPREYQRLVDSGELESVLVDPPSRAQVVRAYVFGFSALVIGLTLAIGIFVALLGH